MGDASPATSAPPATTSPTLATVSSQQPYQNTQGLVQSSETSSTHSPKVSPTANHHAVPASQAPTPASAPAHSPAQAQTQSPSQTQAQAQAQAQAAQAQAQAAAAVAVVGSQSNSDGSAGVEEFPCMWQGCSERCINPEILYEHVCEKHVGRKSTNNLNLTCQWGNCRTTTVKRDHITSHIRVHVPLKPHKCDLCGKAFKRPQDLKKHVKTHADDSVLIRSPGPPDVRSQELSYSMMNNSKGFSAGSHYFEQPMGPVHHGGNYHPQAQYYHGQPHQQPSNPAYGNVYYTLNSGGDNHPAYDSRKRIFDSVNAFFGDTKRRQFDPTSYAAIGQRLSGLQGLQLPISTGPGAEYPGMHGGIAVGPEAGYGPALATPAYHLPPMTNARTKNDLLDLDRMLETIHTTVYESDDHVAAAGIAQPGATYIPRMSHGGTMQQSQPLNPSSGHATATTSNMSQSSGMAAAISPGSTPALTPPSSAVSYVSSHSPNSYTQRVSPPHDQEMAMYPRLPTTSAHDLASGYPAVTSAAPPSTLSNNFGYGDRRRWTGGFLERSRPSETAAKSPADESMEDGERTPTGKGSPGRQAQEGSDHFHNSLIDPALQQQERSSSSPSSPDAEAAKRAAQAAKEAATEVARRGEEQWLENVRILEQLRAYIRDRLSRGDFEEEGSAKGSRPGSSSGADEREGGAEAAAEEDRMEGVEHSEPQQDSKTQSADEKHKHEGSTSSLPILPGLEDSAKMTTSSTSAGLYPTLKGIEEDTENEKMDQA